MREIIIQNKDGSNQEIIKLPNFAWNKVISYARELKQQIDEEEKEEGLSCLFG